MDLAEVESELSFLVLESFLVSLSLVSRNLGLFSLTGSSMPEVS
ncbi:hypothetical protein [Leptotrichia trevisanii]|nr:hypothetical protein [Leptotrichia trevisanii]